MGIFTDDDDDELFDLFMFNEIYEDDDVGKKSKGKKGKKGAKSTKNAKSSGGGCLTGVLLMITVPVGIIIGVVSILT